MLTKIDLNQIQKVVKKVIREEIETETNNLRKDLQGEIKLSRMEIQTDIRKLSQRTKNLEIATNKMQKDLTETKQKVSGIQKDLTETKKDVVKIKKITTKTQKDLDITIKFFDKEHLELQQRVKRTEQHIGFASV